MGGIGQLRERVEGREGLVIFLFALLLHAAGIGGGYVLDDTRAILAHPVVLGEAPLWEAFVREYWGARLDEGWASSWRPITTLTFAIEHRITPEPWLHHLVNTILFGALAGLVTRLARKLGAGAATLAAGALFAALPIHVESVASIVGRADVLAAIACLLAFDLLLERPRSVPRLAAAGLLYLVGLLCKESVALFPGIVIWLGLLEWRRDDASLRDALTPGVALGVVGLAYLALRQSILSVGLPPTFIPADNQLTELSGLVRVWGNFAVLGHYAEITAVPLRLCADHTYADVVPPSGLFEREALQAWVGLALTALIALDGWRAWTRRGTGLFFAFGLSYLLIGQWVIDLSVIVAERIFLWPSVWLLLALGPAIAGLQAGDRRIRIGGLAVLLTLMSWRTVDRSLDWRDSLTLYESSTLACPAAVHNRFNLADAMRKAGRTEDAVWHFGLAGAGRSAYPGRFEVEAFDAELEQPVEKRLPKLPELVGASDPRSYWANMHRFFVKEQSRAEADLVAELAGEGG